MSRGNQALLFFSLLRFAGRRFARSADDLQMVFLYDVNGFIAGMQSPVPVANTDNQYFDYDASAAYNRDTIAGVEVNHSRDFKQNIFKYWDNIKF